MKRSKLLVLSLLAIGAIGLTSCGEGPQGEKGETGAPGEKGASGDQGTPGKDGENGSSVLNGEGVPKDTLGSDGDSYIDYSSFDYYVKESGKWVKKGNLKGPKGETGETGEKGETGSKGEKGETGDTGSTGSRGNQGNTAWSNTILPSNNGYVTVDKGSTTTGETVKFTVKPNSGFGITSLLLNGESAENLGLPVVENKDGSRTYTTTMVDNGYVVQAQFFDKTPKDEGTGDPVAVDTATGYSYRKLSSVMKLDTVKEIKLVETIEETEVIALKENDEKIIDLNGQSLTFKEKGSDGTGTGVSLKNEDSSELSAYNSEGSSGSTDSDAASTTIESILNDDSGETVKCFNLTNGGSLTIEGKGKISGDGVLFKVAGSYDDVAEGKYFSKLTIGEGVETNSENNNPIALYGRYTSKTENDKTTYDVRARGVEINYSGTNTSKHGIWVDETINDTVQPAVININKAHFVRNSSTILGYVKLNVTDSVFDLYGTAFTIEAGEATFKGNTFNVVRDELRKKTPLYVWSSNYTFDANATIYLLDGVFKTAAETIQTLKSVTFEDNKYNYSGDAVDWWSDVYTIQNRATDAEKVKVSGSDVTNKKLTSKVSKSSDAKGKITGKLNDKELVIFFEKEDDAKNYQESVENKKAGMKWEYNMEDSDTLTFSTRQKKSNGEWVNFTEDKTDTDTSSDEKGKTE